MPSIKSVFLLIFSLNLLAIFLLAINMKGATKTAHLTVLNEIDEPKSPYRFDNPFMAYYLLQKLDIFSKINDKALIGAQYNAVESGFKINNQYCDDHRAYFVSHPEFVFEEQNYIVNHIPDHHLRTDVIPALGKDLHPEINLANRKILTQFKSDMKLNANVFFTWNFFFEKRQIGKQFACLSQEANHIPGHDKMYRKDKVGQALVDYAKKYKSKPNCFSFQKYFPKTWILQDKEQCEDFFAEFNSGAYQQMKEERNIVYFRKIGAGVHEGKGVFPVNDDEEGKIREMYGNGTLCGQVKSNNLIQYNVHNILLVENKKVGFRMFMMVASTNPVIAYYHDGYARVSLNDYDPNSKEVITFVTNIGQNIKEAEKRTGLSEEQIQESTLLLLEDFQEYLLRTGQISDPNWLDNYFRPELKKVMIHLIRMAQDSFFKISSLYAIYGLDFVMDENLDLWFIECNAKPLLNGFTKRSTKLLNQIYIDTFEIVLGLLRSRMKRVINYINILSKEVTPVDLTGDVLEAKRKEFGKITKNYFEPEFEPSPTNTFHRIIDENLTGAKRYSNLIDEKCL